MKIAINAVAAFKEKRTGVEEYAYQLIKHFARIDRENQFVLYKSSKQKNDLDFALPSNFTVKSLGAPFLWSQTRLAYEVWKIKPDVLFVPAQVAPFFCAKKSVVTVHGLEYEYFPKQYPMWFRIYLRFFTKYALRNARKIIAVSENTKKDLMKLYEGGSRILNLEYRIKNEELRIKKEKKEQEDFTALWDYGANKIKVIYHGVEIMNFKNQKSNLKNKEKYFIYIGRIETKKNLINLVWAFELFKEKYQLPHQLVLIGGKGYGWQEVYKSISLSKFKKDIILTGFLPESEKLNFLKGADLFVFTSLYEGFGMPVLEAMACGAPVLASNNSSLPEVCGDAAVLVDSQNIAKIEESMYNVVSSEKLRNNLIQKGVENVKRFSWEECARKTLKVLYESSDRS